jgi:hypothetical protein
VPAATAERREESGGSSQWEKKGRGARSHWRLSHALGKEGDFPATGKAIKDSCKKEMPDEFSKEQRAYIDSKLKGDTTYNNPEEVLSALNLKQSKRQ